MNEFGDRLLEEAEDELLSKDMFNRWIENTSSNKEKQAFLIADILSDMILFHSKVRENGENMMKPWN